MNKSLAFLFFLCCAAHAIHAQPEKNPRPDKAAATEVLWDTYGVPHIYASSLEAMYYAFGRAQMHNHAGLLLNLYGQARGRAAEYWGEAYFAGDRLVRLFDLPVLAGVQYDKQEPVFKKILDAFVKGVNDYAYSHLDAIDSSEWVILPITGQDVLAHCLRVVYLEFLAARDIGITQRTKPASNAIAVAASRSASDHALLLANPHLPWQGLFSFFEAQLSAPGFSAYGASLVGIPVLAIAFNRQLGWTHTVNTIDACDRYELKKLGDGYLLDGRQEAFGEKEATIKVRSKDGKIALRKVVFKTSRHGPVLEEGKEKAYAIRIAGMDNFDLLYQWHLMAAARNRIQFDRALQMMQLPMFNVIYADNAGNISYTFAGTVPVRDTGNWKFWQAPVDGTRSAFIWQRSHPYEDLPKLLNPRSGFIQNANDPPWTCTYPPELHPEKYPAYMAPVEMGLRPQRAIEMLKANFHISLQDLVAYKLDTRIEAADRVLPQLIEALRQYPDSLGLQAAALLEKWDRNTDSASAGGVLFTRWLDRMGNDLFAVPWDIKNAMGTPSGLKDPRVAAAIMDSAAGAVLHTYGRLDVPWGEVFRFRRNGGDYAANGGPGNYGIYRTVYYRPEKDGKATAIAGDSYVAVIEFGKEVKAKVLLSYGNSSQPASPHNGDQLKLLSQKELRDALLTREQVLQHLEETERFTDDQTRRSQPRPAGAGLY